MLKRNGKPVNVDAPFTHNDVQYPAGWLRHLSKAERQELNIEEVEDPITKDGRFYFVTQDEAGEVTSIARDLGECKKTLIDGVKQTASALLAQTDWRVLRFVEDQTKPIKDEVLQLRMRIRTKSNKYEEDITACADVEELSMLTFRWE